MRYTHTCFPYFCKYGQKPGQHPHADQQQHCCHCCDLPWLKALKDCVYPSCAVLNSFLELGMQVLHLGLNVLHCWCNMPVCKRLRLRDMRRQEVLYPAQCIIHIRRGAMQSALQLVLHGIEACRQRHHGMFRRGLK